MSSFYFYDLETSGFDPRTQRIMQFAGQRTDLHLEPIGEPDDFLIQLTPDVLPDPDAILVTGITPQRTHLEGITEREFLAHFQESISLPDTIFVGFNTIRFDDEFMRFFHYRNLADPYEWQWKDGRSRWDLLDVVRMTRALRPEGIKWPFAPDGSRANKLELLTAINGLEHTHAHNALSDVVGSIEIAKLIRSKQPKLFDYLLGIRDKTSISQLLSVPMPLVYTSGRYLGEFEKTTIVMPIGKASDPGSTLVYDLRIDPKEWIANIELQETDYPIKLVKHNRCPALAPIGVMDKESWKRIGLTPKIIEQNATFVRENSSKLAELYKPKYVYLQPEPLLEVQLDKVDAALYDGFIGANDKKQLERIRKLSPEELTDLETNFEDKRLDGLVFLYKARQFPKSLLAEERVRWEEYLEHKFLGNAENGEYATFMKRLEELASLDYLDADKRYILEELALYGQSIIPSDGY